MKIIKNRLLSFLLTCAMLVSVLSAFPPIEVWAADIIDDLPILTSPSVGKLKYLTSVSKYAYAQEDIAADSSFELEWDDVADYYTVYVKALDNAPEPGDEEPGVLLYNKQASSGFSNNYLRISQNKLEDCIGKYIKVSIQGKNSNGDNTVRCDYYIYVIKEFPVIEFIDATVNGTEVTFCIDTNHTADDGIVVYADDYELDIDWDKTKYANHIEYVGTYSFNQAGKRVMTVYALDEDGDIVEGSEDSITINIDVLGKVDPPHIITPNNQTIELGDDFTIDWDEVTVSSGVTVKYNVYVMDENRNNVCVNSSKITDTTYTIDSSYFESPGEYVISVIATASNYAQSNDNDASINLKVIEKKENPIIESVDVSSDPVSVGEEFTITVKSNSDTYGIALYVDSLDWCIGKILKKPSNVYSFTYKFEKTNKTDTDGFDITNIRKIYAYPIDSDGNIIYDFESMDYYNITVNPAEHEFSDFEVVDATTDLGNSVTIKWDALTTQNGATVYYNLWIDNEKVAEDLISNSYVLSTEQIKKLGVGSFGIMVIATAKQYRMRQSVGALTIEKPDVVILPGDVNGDGAIDGTDATRLRKYLANNDSTVVPKDTSVTAGADVNGDGKINGKDLTALLNKLRDGNITLPAPEPNPDASTLPATKHTYTVKILLDKADLKATNDRTIYLIPKYGYVKFVAYDETGKEVKLNQAGIIVDLSNSKGVVSFDGYTLKAIKCGYGTISYTQYVDNEKITVDIPIHVGNASKSVSEWPSSYQYLQSDYEYVSMCLDLVYSIHKANMPTEYADVDMNMGDIILDSCANVDEYLKWILGIDWNMSVNVMKKSLSEFIIDYSKYINSNELVMKESKSFSQGFMDLINNIDTTMSTFKDVCDVLKIDKGVITRAIQAFQANDEITDVDLKTIVKFVKELKHHQLIEVMPDAGYFLKGLKELGYSWESFALVSKSTYEFLKTDVSNKIAKSIKSVPNYIGFTADLVEMVLYISVDYSESIKILQNLQKLLLPYFGEDSPEIQAISELIFEFEYDWLEGATGLVLDILAGTINTLGSPIVSLATFAANIAAKLGHVSEKRHITVLTLYVCALHKALEAYMKMYTNGQQALTLQDLKFATSLYLNLIYRQNVLAQKIVKTDWEKAEIDIEIKEIERVFVSYLKY